MLNLVQLPASVFSQNTTFTIDRQNMTLKEVIDEIEHQTDFRFVYRDRFLNNETQLDINVGKKLSVDDFLQNVVKEMGLDYLVLQDNLVIITAQNDKLLLQNYKVQGTVTDPSGTPLPGVNIVEVGTTNGAVTDLDGNYSITVSSEDAVLSFSFVGYLTEEIEVGGQTRIDVMLVEDIQALDEVVVIGYGVTKKKLVTGATVQIKGDNLQKLSTVSPVTAMQSQSPGVSITKISGKPGSDFKINIRGLGTIGNASPLIIIDGIVGGNLNQVNPSDIESIDILKDAAFAAIYGARAANGVILIQTKKGQKGKNTISYDGYYGVQNVAKYVDMVNAQQYLALQEESHENIGTPVPDWSAVLPNYNEIQSGWPGTDWQKEFTNENAAVQNHSLNLTGGSDLSTYSMGLSYTKQEGVYGQPAAPVYNRYNIRLNSEHVFLKNNSFDILKIGENLLYSYIDQDRSRLGTDNINWNDVRWVTRMAPIVPVYDENGEYTKVNPNFGGPGNPIALYDYVRANNENKQRILRANAYMEIQPVKGLVFRTSFGYTFSSSSSREFVPSYDLGGRSIEPLDRVDQSQSSGYGYQLENTLNYNLTAAGSHNFNILLGQSIEKSGLGESMFARNRGAIFDTYEYAYLSNVKTLNPSNVILNGSPWQRHQLSSFFGRLNYDMNETYMLSLIMRADGSSNFAPGKRWGYFPSVAAGWIITNESFMESISGIMDYFKVRASWGQNGNQAISPFQYLATYSFSGADYYFGPEKDSRDVGAYPSILPNKDVTWETSKQINIGFDSRFFGSRMGLYFDWYTKTTIDWLVQAPVPAMWGASAPYINGGDVENKGIELVLNWNDNLGDFSYGISGNIALNNNEVLRIDNPEGFIEGGDTPFSTADRTSFYRAQVGYPIGYFYGYETAGVFQTQAQIDSYTDAKIDGAVPGDVIFVDTDGNGVIDSEDKTMIGDPNPDAIYGFTVNLGYKGFDFSLSANGVAGNQIASSLRQVDGIYDNWPAQYLGRWHGEGTSNRYPRVEARPSASWGWNSDIYVEDGDFLRIQNVTLGYDLGKLMKVKALSMARIYISANNLYTFTDYFGADPEIGHADEGWSKGIDVGFYPSPRTMLLGINLKF